MNAKKWQALPKGTRVKCTFNDEVTYGICVKKMKTQKWGKSYLSSFFLEDGSTFPSNTHPMFLSLAD